MLTTLYILYYIPDRDEMIRAMIVGLTYEFSVGL